MVAVCSASLDGHAMMIILRNIPNLLTCIRLVLAPLAAFFILEGQYLLAFAIFTIAGLSDAADGFLAKRFGLESTFGAWLDPAADKLLMLLCFVTLTYVGIVPFWLTAIVIGRDVAIVIGVALARLFSLPVAVEVLPAGKISTIVQVGYVAIMLAFVAFRVIAPDSVEALGVLTAAATLFSGLIYGQVLLRALIPGSKTA